MERFSKHALIVFVLGVLTLVSCKKDEPLDEPVIPVTSGMLVGCEGTFGQLNATIHMVFDDGSKRDDIYLSVNGTTPGDILQSVRIFDDNTYLVMNSSQKVNIIGTSDLALQATITGCDYPRDVFQYSDVKGYLTNGNLEGEVLIFNPLTASITGSIDVGMGPEEIVYNGTYLFVANSGGWDYDNTVSVIDPASDQVIATVEVGDRPVALEVDYQNNVWVLCKGDIVYDSDWNIIEETNAQLVRIDGQAHVVTGLLNVGETGDHPQFMAIDGTGKKLYIENGDIKLFNVDLGEFAPTFAAGEFHGVGVNPVSGEVLTASGIDYVNRNDVHIFSPEGELTLTHELGIAPRSYAYRY